MLHALLHHKLDETTPEPQRLEDALTSTVFGTMVMVEAADVLAAWLSRARRIDDSRTPVEGPLNGVWFWPQLALAEPDVIIQLGDRLFVIEAKLQSGKADLQGGMEDPGHIADQLQREWVSLGPDYASRARCDRDLSEAIASCAHTLVYVVDGRRLRRATREFTESARLLSADADLRLLTWQSLHEHLARQSSARCRWRDLLSQYLQDRGLHGFDGFADQRRKRPFNPRRLVQWCCLAGSHTPLHLRQAFGVSQELQEVLRGWRPDYAAGSSQTWPSDWIKRCAAAPHSFLLAASWTVAGSRSSEIQLRRTMDLFSAEHAPGLRRCVKKFTID
ncbi:MAG: hypothetical protein IID41_01825 [Planctomycetes bacterium]|nr:hypothetical protein [Planctomycetota bacterium]